jgi:hypothetical protein
VPKSGMADRGRKIYAANGCVYCHSQQVRADYAASDIDRKWGTRRSAPRDYIFERPALLGKMRVGPDLANIGKRAPAEDQSSPTPAPTSPAPAASPTPSPPANAPATSAATSPAAASPSPAPTKAVAANSPTPAPASAANTSPAPPASPSPAATTAETGAAPGAGPPQYSAAWHHLHLYSPRSVTQDSNMPAYHFLYEKRRIGGERSADALNLSGANAPDAEWEIVPTYDAKCLVAYLMSLDQSHELKEAKLTSAPAAAPAATPASAPATTPAPAKEEKK